MYNSITELEQSNCAHEWGVWTASVTEGKQKRTCTICGKKEEKWDLIIGAIISGYNPRRASDGSTITTSYTVPVGELNEDGTVEHGSGSTSEQTFSLNTLTLDEWDDVEWRILGEENGQILITTSDPIKTSAEEPSGLTFSGFIGFASFEDELNSACSIYGHGKYADTGKYETSGARSIKLEDFQLAGAITSISSGSRAYNKSSTEFKYWDEFAGGTKTWKELTSTNTSVTIVAPTQAYTSSGLTSSSLIIKMLNKKKDKTDSYYWLASRCVAFSTSKIVTFIGRTRSGNGFSVTSGGTTSGGTQDIRPVVYLLPSVNLSLDDSGSIPVYTITGM